MKSWAFFPWRLFKWFVTQQLVAAGLLFLVLSVILAYFMKGDRAAILFSVALAFATFVPVSLWTARRLLLPLGRIIEKTRRMREFPFDDDEVDPEEMTFDEPGEWYEMERALNRLGRDLRNKTIRLSREKTELRAIMSAASEAVLSIDGERKVMFYNPQFAYLFDPKSNPGEVTISELLRSPDILAAYDEVMKSGKPVRREVQEEVGADKGTRDFLLSVAPLAKKHNQEIYGVVGIFHDITELKAAERIRIEFVGNVSHELRTPLTTVNGYLQTLTSDVEKGRLDHAKEFLQIVSQNVTRLKNLVDDLLDLSSLESGKELKMEMVNVQDITEAVLRQINSSAHKIHLHYDFEEMLADAKRLEQVLRNLLENAVRYVPEGKNIEVRWHKAGDRKVELHVKDDGPGIAQKHQARLFERFYRVDEARSRATGGTGIGLSLVKHIVQRHGGEVHVKSVPGAGSEFICEFPS